MTFAWGGQVGNDLGPCLARQRTLDGRIVVEPSSGVLSPGQALALRVYVVTKRRTANRSDHVRRADQFQSRFRLNPRQPRLRSGPGVGRGDGPVARVDHARQVVCHGQQHDRQRTDHRSVASGCLGRRDRSSTRSRTQRFRNAPALRQSRPATHRSRTQSGGRPGDR